MKKKGIDSPSSEVQQPQDESPQDESPQEDTVEKVKPKRKMSELQLETLKKGREARLKRKQEEKPMKEAKRKQNIQDRIARLKQNRALTEEELLKKKMKEEKEKAKMEKRVNKKVEEAKKYMNYILEESESSEEEEEKVVVSKRRAQRMIDRAVKEAKQAKQTQEQNKPVISEPLKTSFIDLLNKGRSERINKENKWL